VVWMTGPLELLGGSDRFSLQTPSRRIDIHCGDPVDIHRDGRWERGRVEFSSRLGWYWTNNQVDRRLLAGDQVRVWDGGLWPQRERGGASWER
jgi:hypothetical protein